MVSPAISLQKESIQIKRVDEEIRRVMHENALFRRICPVQSLSSSLNFDFAKELHWVNRFLDSVINSLDI